MRVDKFLSIAGLVRRTAVKKEGVEIKVNGSAVRPSKKIRVGDLVSVSSPALSFKIEVLKIPDKKSISARMRKKYYRVIEYKKEKKEITSEFVKWLLED